MGKTKNLKANEKLRIGKMWQGNKRHNCQSVELQKRKSTLSILIPGIKEMLTSPLMS